MSCPVCKKNPLDGPVWESDDGVLLHLACADALVNTILAATEARYTYTRTIAESLIATAAQRLAQPPEPAPTPPLLRLLEA